jgi:hypothetical protein
VKRAVRIPRRGGDQPAASGPEPTAKHTGPASAGPGGFANSGVYINIDSRPMGAGLFLPLARAAQDPRPLFRAADVSSFTGREWLADEVKRFIATYRCGYVFIEAEAGLGKTAFAAWLVQTRGYLSHFSRYPDGSSVEGALANLSAQLIIRFGLDGQAPGGMLPEWARTPSGFGSLLTMAADLAHEQGRPIMLVVDGLDEADEPADGLPLGLPSLLPDGVYVIATYRTGRTPGRPDVPARTVRIAKEDKRNQNDIREYLNKVISRGDLAACLAEASMDAEEFSGLLATRCGGVWVYLRYVLDELRFGLRRPDEIGDLPSGLRDYYASQIRRWRQDPAWPTGLLPLLATLGVAGEALSAASLARLAGNIDPAAVQRWCDLTIRPMLTTNWTFNATTPIRYSIYHASFREFLNSDYDDPSTSSGDQQSYGLLALAAELRQTSITAHNRICDIYLTEFGGLDDGLPVLAGHPGAAGADDGYPLRHLAHHLRRADRSSDLHALLAIEHSNADGRLVNTWFAAHDHDNSTISYLDDLALARNDAETATGQHISRGKAAPSLGAEIRYALMAASTTSHSAEIPADLLRQLLETGVWSSQRVLDHARRIIDPKRQLDALLVVCGTVDDEERPAVLTEALAAAIAIRGFDDRAGKLTELAPCLPADQRPPALAEALAAASAIPHGARRAAALAELAPYLPADLLAQALAAATAIPEGTHRARVLAGLAPHLPADLLAQALAAATAIPGDTYRALALRQLAPHLPADLLAQALVTATATPGDSVRAWALTGVAPYLPADEQPAVLAQALAAATAVADDYDRAGVLTVLAPHLPADEQPAVLALALAAATAVSDSSFSSERFTALAPYLTTDLLAPALDTAIAIAHEQSRAEALTVLAPYLPAHLLAQALATASTIPSDYFRAETLIGLAPHLRADERPAVLAQALDAASAIPNDYDRVEKLAELVPHLPADQRPAALAQALNAFTALNFLIGPLDILVTLVRHLPPNLLAQALTAALADAQLPTGLAPHLAADEQPAVLALAAATAIATTVARVGRAKVLTALAPYLPADQRPAVLTQALGAATATAVVLADSYRAEVLTALAPYLPADQRPAVLTQALDAATAISGSTERIAALRQLAPQLHPDQRPAVLAQALDVATAIPNHQLRAETLSGLAPYLPADLLAQALDVATAIPSDYFRAKTLTGLAPYLTVGLLAQVLATTIADDEEDRAWVLTEMAPYLPAHLLTQALDTATAITDDDHRARTLAGLAPYLPADQQPAVLTQALTVATALRHSSTRANALTRLAPYLPAGQLAQALDAATAITDDDHRARTLAGLARYLPADQQPAVLSQALASAVAIPDDSARAWTLTELAPYLPADRQLPVLSQALAVASSAAAFPKDYDRALIVTALALRLPANQRLPVLAQALAIAVAIPHNYYRADMLTRLAPYMPDGQQPAVLTQALAAVVGEPRDSARGELLRELAPLLSADLLAQALETIPKTGVEALSALLQRGRMAFPRTEDAAYLNLLRKSIDRTDRRVCLGLLTTIAPAVADIGGVGAIQQCVDAIADVHRWWP